MADRNLSTTLVHQLEKAPIQEYSWGWIRWLINSEIDSQAEMTFGVVYLNAHESNPLHVHSGCEEHLYVLDGSCEHRIGDEWITLKAGDVVRIPAGISHMARTLEEPMRAVIVYSSGTRDVAVVEEGASEGDY